MVLRVLMWPYVFIHFIIVHVNMHIGLSMTQVKIFVLACYNMHQSKKVSLKWNVSITF